MEIGNITVNAGEKKNGFLAVEGSLVSLPLTVICGRAPGRTVLITAGIHGAEYIAVQTLLEFSRELVPEDICGSVICVLTANPSAFCNYTRFVVPEDGKNPNRVFPGRADGTAAERLAFTISDRLFPIADNYIDIHAGDTSENAMPFAYFNISGSAEVSAASEEMAAAADMKIRAASSSVASTFGSACRRGLPAVLLERGGAGRFSTDEVHLYKRDVRNILAHLGVLKADEVHSIAQRAVRKASYLEADSTGCWYPALRAGDEFEAGAFLGRLCDVWGNTLHEYYAEYSGILLYQTESLGIKESDPLVAYGRPE